MADLAPSACAISYHCIRRRSSNCLALLTILYYLQHSAYVDIDNAVPIRPICGSSGLRENMTSPRNRKYITYCVVVKGGPNHT